MDEDITNKQTNDNSEAATERERRPSEERGSTERSNANVGSTEVSRPNVAQEYLDNWKRERADFLNYKKDEMKRLSEFAKFADEGVVLEVIELMDDLETASKEIGNPGLNQIVKKFEEFLKKHNVERIDTKNTFDPLLHEAVSTTEFLDPLKQGQETTPREEGGDKIEEMRAGYTMHGKVIRPARVKIIK